MTDTFIDDFSSYIKDHPYKIVYSSGNDFKSEEVNETIINWLNDSNIRKSFLPFSNDKYSFDLGQFFTHLKHHQDDNFDSTASDSLVNSMYDWCASIAKHNQEMDVVCNLLYWAFYDFDRLTDLTKEKISEVVSSGIQNITSLDLEKYLDMLEADLYETIQNTFLEDCDKLIDKCKKINALGGGKLISMFFFIEEPEQVNSGFWFADIEYNNYKELQNNLAVIAKRMQLIFWYVDNELFKRYIQFHFYNFVKQGNTSNFSIGD